MVLRIPTKTEIDNKVPVNTCTPILNRELQMVDTGLVRCEIGEPASMELKASSAAWYTRPDSAMFNMVSISCNPSRYGKGSKLKKKSESVNVARYLV